MQTKTKVGKKILVQHVNYLIRCVTIPDYQFAIL